MRAIERDLPAKLFYLQMMMRVDPYENLIGAIDKNAIDKFLMGIGPYYYADRFANVPTDIGEIVSAFNRYSDVHGRDKASEILERGLTELLATPEGTWWAASIVTNYLFYLIPTAIRFDIDVSHCQKEISEAVKKHETALTGNQKFVGVQFKNGLWDITQKLLHKINHSVKGV